MTGREDKLLIEVEEEDWDAVVDVNLKGAFNTIKAVAPKMIEKGDGHIILTASGQALRGAVRRSYYTAAKAGVIGLMKSAARELGEFNIKVNTIIPGLIVHSPAFRAFTVAEEYLKETVLHRHQTPEELARFVVHLSQTENISGQCFQLDSRF